MEALADLAGHLLLLLLSFSSSNVHEQLGDLVRVHARSRDLDGTGPVEVVVAQGEGELLHSVFLQLGVIEGNVEVSRQNASLVGELGNQEEVVLEVRTLALDELLVDDAA